MRDLDKLQEKSAERLFSYLLAEPLRKICGEQDQTVIVIDALDEAGIGERNELADILASSCMLLPDWVKIVVTSRDEPVLRRRLSGFHPICFEDTKFVDNAADIRGYFKMLLQDILTERSDADEVLDALVSRSAGNFLYAKMVAGDIRSGVLTAYEQDAFPNGLTGVYSAYFDRLFHDRTRDYKEEIRPVLEVLCAEYNPLRSEDLIKILKMDEYDFHEIQEAIAQMFPERGGVLEPVHKSIVDWLTDHKKAGEYRVSLRRGHKRLAKYCMKQRRKGRFSSYVLKYTVRHLLHAGMDDAAVEVLNDTDFQDLRIGMIGLDSAMREYLSEIGLLLHQGCDVKRSIYQKAAFQKYFAHYRRFFHNTGLYFTLQKYQYDSAAEDLDPVRESADMTAGTADYWYITERFDQAILLTRNLLQREDLTTEVMLEMHNVLGLSLRKRVCFDQAREQFETAFQCKEASDDAYDKSTVAMNLGKLSYHELDWESAAKWNEQGLKLLHEAYSETGSEDMQIHIKLFIAEYHRLVAECVIWNQDIENARRHLDEAAAIYGQIISRDRYYVRYIYTSALTKIFSGHMDEGLALCTEASAMAASKYDKSQILFYQGMAYLLKKENQRAVLCAGSGKLYAQEIGAWLEYEELTILESIANGDAAAAHTELYEENTYIHRWSDYVQNILRGFTR